MEKTKLNNLVAHLKKILDILTDSNTEDSWFRKSYSEYLVASKLAGLGYDIQIGTERDVKNADIYLSSLDKRVEVKSGLYDTDEYGVYSVASLARVHKS